MEYRVGLIISLFIAFANLRVGKFNEACDWLCQLFDIIMKSTHILIVSGGPDGLITFTALSNTSINIQVDKGDNVGQFETFDIYKGPFAELRALPTPYWMLAQGISLRIPHK